MANRFTNPPAATMIQILARCWPVRWMRGTMFQDFKANLDKHFFFYLALIAAGVILFRIPQIFAIWSEFPPFKAEARIIWVWVKFGGFVLLLFGFYVLSIFVVLRQFPIQSVHQWVGVWVARQMQSWKARGRWRFIHPWFWISLLTWRLPDLVSRWLVAWASNTNQAAPGARSLCRMPLLTHVTHGDPMRVSGWLRIGSIVLSFSMGGVLFTLAEMNGSHAYPLDGIFCRGLGLWALLAGSWLLAQAIFRRTYRDTNPGCVSVYVGRLLAWLLATYLAGEFWWLLADNGEDGAGSKILAWFHVKEYLGTAFSYRLYTIWAVAQLLTTLIILGLLVDCWHQEASWPVRQFILLLLPLVIWGFTRSTKLSLDDVAHDLTAEQREAWVYQRSIPPNEADKARTRRNEEWFKRFLQRVTAVTECEGTEGPVVIVAASGGGSRAAIFTALVYETLARTPIDPYKGDGRKWADNIVLISSVSGGSLATAHFVRNRGCGEQPKLTELRNTTPDELTERLKERAEQMLAEFPKHQPQHHLDKYLSDYGTKSDKFTYLLARYKDLQKERNALLDLRKKLKTDQKTEEDALTRAKARAQCEQSKEALVKTATDLTATNDRIAFLENYLAHVQTYDFLRGLPPHGAVRTCLTPDQVEHFDWVRTNRMFDEMCLDFMAPIMRGSLSPLNLDRGDSLARFWTKRFNWYNCTNFDGYAKCGYNPCIHPLVVFNATDVAQGARLAIGFPTLPSNLWGPVYDSQGATRARPVALSEWGPNYKLSLARAVRMSSNFPFGFRAMELLQSCPEEQPTPHHVLDGGVVDNTGLDTIYEVLRALETYAEPTELECHGTSLDKGELDNYSNWSREILEKLRKRGVVILEIDSGAKPDEKISSTLKLFPGVTVPNPFAGLTEPIQALNNAAYGGADQDKQTYVTEIRRILNRNFSELPKDDLCKENALAYLNKNLSLPVTTLSLSLQCNHYKPGETPPDPEVMTAWALGPKEKAEVVHSSLVELASWRIRLLDIDADLHDGQHQFDKILVDARKLLQDHLPVTVNEFTSKNTLGGMGDPQRKYDRMSRQKKMMEK